MATATPPQAPPSIESGEHRFLIRNLGWERYEVLLSLFEDGGPRINYHGGNVELMSPLVPHERPRHQLGFVVGAVTEELNIPMDAVGSTTFKRRDAERGLEADESYYLGDNAGMIARGRKYVDLDVDPPPDLAIEIEITNPLLDKLDIYSGIGVPEIWKYNGEALSVLLLGPDGRYAESAGSRAFPFLPMDEVARFIREYEPGQGTSWRRRFRAWVREVLLPSYLAQQG